MKILTIIFIICLIIIPLGCKTTEIISEPIAASVLYEDYVNNRIRADEHYRNKILTMDGVISLIDRDNEDKAYLMLHTGHTSFIELGVVCYFKKENESDLVNLAKEQRVKIKGECVGIPSNSFYQHVTVINCNVIIK